MEQAAAPGTVPAAAAAVDIERMYMWDLGLARSHFWTKDKTGDDTT